MHLFSVPVSHVMFAVSCQHWAYTSKSGADMCPGSAHLTSRGSPQPSAISDVAGRKSCTPFMRMPQFADAAALSHAGDHTAPAFPSAVLISPRRASMLGKAAASAAAASASAASAPSAVAADDPFRPPAAAGLSQSAQTWLPAGAASIATPALPSRPSSPATTAAQGREQRRTRRDSVRSGLGTAALLAAGAAGEPPDALMDLAVFSATDRRWGRRQPPHAQHRPQGRLGASDPGGGQRRGAEPAARRGPGRGGSAVPEPPQLAGVHRCGAARL